MRTSPGGKEGRIQDAGEIRNDTTQKRPKSIQTILSQQISQGLAEIRRPARGLILSGLSAGLDIGFSVLFMGTMLTLMGEAHAGPAGRMLVASMYSVGFIFVLLGRSELFTEHTALAVFPVLDGEATLTQLARLWALVYLANLVGGALSAVLTVNLGPRLEIIEPWALTWMAEEMVQDSSGTMFLSAVTAGWLMGLLSWLVTAAQDTVSRIAVVWIITFGMGLTGLHHCVVGTVEVLSGVLTDPGVNLGDYGRFLGVTTLGNALGGVMMVAMLKYAHAVVPGEKP